MVNDPFGWMFLSFAVRSFPASISRAKIRLADNRRLQLRGQDPLHVILASVASFKKVQLAECLNITFVVEAVLPQIVLNLIK